MTITALTEWIAHQRGLDRALLQQSSFLQFLHRRLERLGMDQPAYLQLLQRDSAELDRVVQEIAVPETWLFRYPASFEFLLAELRGRRRTAPAAQLRLLSAGCASGEEAYCLAITAARAGWPDAVVDAVDGNAALVNGARRATYSTRALRTDAPRWALEWIRVDNECVVISPRVARMVTVDQANLLRDRPPRTPYDVIFCRNLLIYLNRKARRNLSRHLVQWLAPDGLLCLGHAEATAAMWEDWLQPVRVPGTFAWRKGPAKGAAACQARSESPPRRGAAGETADGGSGHHRGRTTGVPPQVIPPLAAPSQTPARDGSRRSDPPASGPAQTQGGSRHGPSFRDRGAEGPAAPTLARLDASAIAGVQALANAGQLPAALQAAQQVLNERGPCSETCHLLGSLYLALGNLDAAREAFRKVIYLQPGHADALLQLANIYRLQGKPGQAARYRQRAAIAHQQNTGGAR
jgi:chemotaxis protein methyltransferase WspC